MAVHRTVSEEAKLGAVKRFEDLNVWQDARAVTKRVYDVTKRSPFKEDYDLRRQIRDAAISIMSNIAEGFERGSTKEFIQALFIARGSAGEVRSDLYPALDQQYIRQEEFEELRAQCEGVSRQIVALAKYLRGSEYKGDKFREDKAVYEVRGTDSWDSDLEPGILDLNPET